MHLGNINTLNSSTALHIALVYLATCPQLIRNWMHRLMMAAWVHCPESNTMTSGDGTALLFLCLYFLFVFSSFFRLRFVSCFWLLSSLFLLPFSPSSLCIPFSLPSYIPSFHSFCFSSFLRLSSCPLSQLVLERKLAGYFEHCPPALNPPLLSADHFQYIVMTNDL